MQLPRQPNVSGCRFRLYSPRPLQRDLLNPTNAALHLLSEVAMIMRQWDAITILLVQMPTLSHIMLHWTVILHFSTNNMRFSATLQTVYMNGGTKLLKPTILLAVLASMLLLTGIACGGTTQETDTETDAGAMSGETTTTDSGGEQATTAPDSGSSAGSGQASQPGATSIVATATPSATNTPSAAQQSELVGGRLSMAVTPSGAGVGALLVGNHNIGQRAGAHVRRSAGTHRSL